MIFQMIRFWHRSAKLRGSYRTPGGWLRSQVFDVGNVRLKILHAESWLRRSDMSSLSECGKYSRIVLGTPDVNLLEEYAPDDVATNPPLINQVAQLAVLSGPFERNEA